MCTSYAPGTRKSDRETSVGLTCHPAWISLPQQSPCHKEVGQYMSLRNVPGRQFHGRPFLVEILPCLNQWHLLPRQHGRLQLWMVWRHPWPHRSQPGYWLIVCLPTLDLLDKHISTYELLCHLLCVCLSRSSWNGAQVPSLSDSTPCVFLLMNGKSRLDVFLRMSIPSPPLLVDVGESPSTLTLRLTS